MESQVLQTVWCYISCEATGEIWNWSLLEVRGLKTIMKTLGWEAEVVDAVVRTVGSDKKCFDHTHRMGILATWKRVKTSQPGAAQYLYFLFGHETTEHVGPVGGWIQGPFVLVVLVLFIPASTIPKTSCQFLFALRCLAFHVVVILPLSYPHRCCRSSSRSWTSCRWFCSRCCTWSGCPRTWTASEFSCFSASWASRAWFLPSRSANTPGRRSVLWGAPMAFFSIASTAEDSSSACR